MRERLLRDENFAPVILRVSAKGTLEEKGPILQKSSPFIRDCLSNAGLPRRQTRATLLLGLLRAASARVSLSFPRDAYFFVHFFNSLQISPTLSFKSQKLCVCVERETVSRTERDMLRKRASLGVGDSFGLSKMCHDDWDESFETRFLPHSPSRSTMIRSGLSSVD